MENIDSIAYGSSNEYVLTFWRKSMKTVRDVHYKLIGHV